MPSVDPRFGRSTDYSSWTHRAPLVALGLVGMAVAGYLSLYQLGLTSSVWDPIFGAGSEKVITSAVSRALPVPDAALGVVAYLADVLLASVGGRHRWETDPWLVVADGLVVLGLVLTGLALTVTQLFVFHAGCTLCLVSAAVSFTSGWLARAEVVAAIDRLRHPAESESASAPAESSSIISFQRAKARARAESSTAAKSRGGASPRPGREKSEQKENPQR